MVDCVYSPDSWVGCLEAKPDYINIATYKTRAGNSAFDWITNQW